MERRLAALPFTFLIAAMAGCGPSGTPADEHGNTAAGASHQDALPAGTSAAGDSHAAHAASDSAGERVLPIMQRLGTNMTSLTYALLTEDRAGMQQSAAAIAAHAPISAPELGRIGGVLGAEMALFERLDAEVHAAAERLHQSADGDDPAAVVAALSEVQRGCVECHSRFRERLRTNR